GQGEGPVRKGPREACAARLEGLELAGAGEGRGLEELIFRVLEDRPRDGHLLPLDATTAPPTAAGSAPGSGHAAPRRRETVVGAAGGANRRAVGLSGAAASPRDQQEQRRATPDARHPPFTPRHRASIAHRASRVHRRRLAQLGGAGGQSTVNREGGERQTRTDELARAQAQEAPAIVRAHELDEEAQGRVSAHEGDEELPVVALPTMEPEHEERGQGETGR